MANGTLGTGRRSIGVDVSDKYSQVCVLDEQGEVAEETRLRTKPDAFVGYFGSREPADVTIEAGTHSPWMSRLLEECGHDVLVANPRRVELISKSDSKDDRTDAEVLARVRRVDPKLLAPVEHRDKQAQLDIELLRARDTLVRTRTLLTNHVRGAVKSFGGRLTACSAEAFAARALEDVPQELRFALAPLLDQIKHLTQEIRAFDKRIEAATKKRYPQTELLRQVPGVGPITALCYVLTIADPGRFKMSRAVGSYLGLRPRKDESGTSSPELRITKAGDSHLRRLLVQSAQYILGPFGKDTALRRWGLKLAARGRKRAKKVAVVAVARKLAVLLHRLWVTGEVYEPLRNAKEDTKAA